MRLRLVLLVGLVLVLGSVTAVGWAGYGRTTVHDDGEGPLSASSGHGGGYAAPRPGVWYLAFAGNELCLREPGAPVTITGTRFDVRVPPRKLRTFVRTVSDQDVREGKVGHVFVGSAAYDRLADRGKDLRGTFSAVPGTVVDRPCLPRSGRDEGWEELVLELEVGPPGALVPRTYVDYTRGRRSYTLVVDWEMGACGRVAKEVLGDDYC